MMSRVARIPRVAHIRCVLIRSGLSWALLPIAVLISCSHSSSTSPTMTTHEHLAWHAQRLETLRAEDGWLTLVGLDFLTDGSHTLGSSPSATFHYPNCQQPVVGTLVVRGDSVEFTPTGGATTALKADDALGGPSVIRSGPVSFTLVRRNGALALRVRDNLSPVRTGFTAIPLYPFDPALVVEARVMVPAPDAVVAITNIRGFTESQPIRATLEFTLGDATHRLTATAGSGERLFVVFADATTGSETYGGGRFLDLPAPKDGRVIIDFNRAYNPPCSFTAYATCPLPPEGNRLSVPVRGGERSAGSSDLAPPR